MERSLSNAVNDKVGQKVKMQGWAQTIRDHAKVLFIDLRDRHGLTQLVFTGDLLDEARKISAESVITIEGEVVARPEKLRNPKLPSGEVEISVQKLIVESIAQPLPMPLNDRSVNEDSRLKYRYLDLRSEKIASNLRTRHKLNQFIRDYLTEREFIEIETPYISKSTPEGARDYLVPSRIAPGKFYALPQSPQQYKQLLMVAGMEKYFQIARCFRDEDARTDRQPEFTQLDLEMSFADREAVMALNEELLIALVKKLAPSKKIQTVPFPRLSYQEAMEKYQTDRPDLREDKNNPNLLAFCWVVDFPFFEKTPEGSWTFTHNPFSSAKTESAADLLVGKNIDQILTSQYDIVLNGSEIGGGSIRNHQPEALAAVFKVMGLTDDKIKQNFGHMIEAFSFGAPPHGGIAWGLDRFYAILCDEDSIRDVIAFAKAGDGRDLMMNAPSEVDDSQLKELGIQLRPKK